MARALGVSPDRRARGAWATPPVLVEHVLDVALEPVLAARSGPDGLVVLDPACGDGRFLVAAASRIAARFGIGMARAARCCAGVEVDAPTAAGARARLGGHAEIVVGDALDGAWERPVDVVVGNPPFLTPLRTRTRASAGQPGGAPYADAATAFWRLALDLARPAGGCVGLVLPASVLAARDAGPARAAAAGQGRVRALWWAGTSVFEAAVDTCAITVVRGEPQGTIERWHGPDITPLGPVEPGCLGDGRTWGHLVADAAGIPRVDLLPGGGTIGDLATVTADFRDQYYGLVDADAVHDDGDGPPLVTVGLIDPGRCRWSQRSVTFARRRLATPRVDLGALPIALRRWADRRLVPKVLVATQTRVIEAVVDADGAWLPSVPVISIVPHRHEDLWPIGAALCAPALSASAAATYLGAGLSSSALKLSARQVAGLALPTQASWAEATAALEAGDASGCAHTMADAYELGPSSATPAALFEWWHAAAAARGVRPLARRALPR